MVVSLCIDLLEKHLLLEVLFHSFLGQEIAWNKNLDFLDLVLFPLPVFDTKFSMHYIGVRDGKKGKGRQTKLQHGVFLLHNILQPSVGVYKFEDS